MNDQKSINVSRAPHISRQYNHFQSSFEDIDKADKYLNYGYTLAKGETLEQKQRQLCLEVFKAANIQPDDVIVDVGFGSGEQDFLLASEYSFQKLNGFNIADRQVEYARNRARELNLTEKLVFHHGQAENMPQLAAQSVDKVIAIECAFYFQRPRFYQEAARVMKPGGLLVLADITLSDVLHFLTPWTEEFKRAGSYSQNQADWEQYFQTQSVKPITRYTRPGAQMAVFQILKWLPTMPAATRITWLKMAVITQLVVLGFLTDLIRYDLVVLTRK
ncbi:SAM-dependent methyltransferase [candidate division CSSED10-310 bacterium]|uniref:SAM-dependent methyltransferase n=1 Tax=candidate division CSSED10-310 bacterium TaxID=2855610 RepID=A0ABV6YS50_UNCC1